MSTVLVVLEYRAGKFARINWEALAAAARLAAPADVTAVVLGADTESLAAEIAAKAPGKVIRVEHPLLTPYTADGFCLSLQQLIQSECPTYVVLPHTYQVRDFAPALAARLGQVLIGDVIAIKDGPVFTRQLMQGRLTGDYRTAGSGPSSYPSRPAPSRPTPPPTPRQPPSQSSRPPSTQPRSAPAPPSPSAPPHKPSISHPRK